jgi:superkiller protein 3
VETELRQVLNQATAAFQEGNYDEAERLLLALAERPPVYANVYNMLGFIYSQRGLPEKAIELFRRALGVNPNYTEAQINLAITLSDIGVYDQAVAEYRKVQDREEQAGAPVPSLVRDRLANAHSGLGLLYHALRLFDHAVTEFDKALTWAPRFADIHLRRAQSLAEQGNLQEAAGGLGQALRINPRYVQAHLELGLVYLRQGRREEAAKAWEQALALEPENQLAKLYLRQVTGGPAAPSP